MMKKILKWMKRNTGLVIVLLLTLVLLGFITVIFIKLLMGNSSGKYGNRLDGINEVVISDETYDSVEEEVKATEKVTDVTLNISDDMFIDNTYIIIKRGKKNYYVGKK